MHPRDQPEGGQNTEVKGREKIEREEAKEQRQRKGEKEQRESGYIETHEQQRRGVSDTGCETPLASNQMQRNPTEEANQEDADRREEEEDKTWTEEWWTLHKEEKAKRSSVIVPVNTFVLVINAKIQPRPKPSKPYFRPTLRQVVSEVGSEEIEAVVTKMAEGQQKLERIMEWFLKAATEDRETMKKAISGQTEKLETVTQAQETSI
ncbi:hypothetical protein NDU88_005411 [Pleurodeles waltl]|uniref:Uncharacterized protein n=1 Tax=Pleurodeles waltl TaxID=8319 RepID=A0AAV7L7E7_PLEWA|nr:hypothetical protein NDU88_005411 [Pleurodeles waltl]